VDGLDEPKPLEAPAETPTDGVSREVGRNVQEVRRGDYILRRTMIDEVIYEPLDKSGKTEDEAQPHESR